MALNLIKAGLKKTNGLFICLLFYLQNNRDKKICSFCLLNYYYVIRLNYEIHVDYENGILHHFLDGILLPYLSPVWLIIVLILIKIPLSF